MRPHIGCGSCRHVWRPGVPLDEVDGCPRCGSYDLGRVRHVQIARSSPRMLVVLLLTMAIGGFLAFRRSAPGDPPPAAVEPAAGPRPSPVADETPAARLASAEAIYRDRRYDDARRAFEGVAADCPGTAAAEAAAARIEEIDDCRQWIAFGENYLANGRKDDARAMFEKVRLLHPESPFADEALGLLRATED